MPVINLTDKYGTSYLARKSPKGRLLAVVYDEDTMDNVRDITVRDDDVFLASPVKAGSHWTHDILNLLIHGEKSLHDPKLRAKQDYMIELNSRQHLQELASPRILNHHLPFEELPDQLFTTKAKVVYLYRNLKDCCVSLYHMVLKMKSLMKWEGSFSEFLERIEDGLIPNDIFDFVREWDRGLRKLDLDLDTRGRVIVLRYEDMKSDIIPELKRLADFLQVDASDERLRRIAELVEFDAMKARMNNIARSDSSSQTSDLARSSDGGHVVFRKGIVGDWKNHFTVAENEKFDRKMKEKLGDDLVYHKFKYEL